MARRFALALEELGFTHGIPLDLGLSQAARASKAFLGICRQEGVDVSRISGAANNAIIPSILFGTRPRIFVDGKVGRFDPGAPEAAAGSAVAMADEPDMDKFARMDLALDQGRLWDEMETARERLGKKPEELRVFVKSNISMCARREDDGTYCDPELALYLVSCLMERGYTDVTVGEAQNLYGNWYRNREVARVAAHAGYMEDRGQDLDLSAIAPGEEAWGKVFVNGAERGFRLVDMTRSREVRDMGDLGKWELSREWLQADFRINFCKAKTHFFSFITLCVKNLYGALPEQNKMVAYHGNFVTASLTSQMLAAHPAHFHVVDANTVSDGIIGAKLSAVSKKPKRIIAGASLLGVEAVASMLLGVNPRASFYFREAHRRAGGLGPVRVIGEGRPIRPFRHVPWIVIRFCKEMEKIVRFATLIGYVFNGQVDKEFPSKRPLLQPLAKLLLLFPYPMLTVTNWSKVKVHRARIGHWLFCRKHRQKLGLSVKNREVRTQIRHLGPAQLGALLALLEKGQGTVRRLGHWVEQGQARVPVVAVTPSASRAVCRLVFLAQSRSVDAKGLKQEVQARIELFEQGLVPASASFFADQNR